MTCHIFLDNCKLLYIISITLQSFIMKIRFCKVAVLLILLVVNIWCLDTPSSRSTAAARNDSQAASFPLMVEYIPKFKVTANDLKNAIKNQLSTITTGNINTSYVSIDQALCNLTYKNGGVPVYQTALRVTVTNDSYAANCSFKATVIHSLNSKKYSCYAVTSDITVNYTKQVDYVSGSTLVLKFSTSYSSDSFNAGAVCAEKESDKDKVRINQALSNTEAQSVYLELKKTLDKMKEVFQQNVQTQHLSQLFPDNPFVYAFYDFKVDVNVSTVAAEKFKEDGVVNKIKGTVPGSSKFPASSPAYEQGYSLFFAKEFVQNLLDYSLLNLKNWTNIKASRSNMRTNSFRFRLVDYEFIMPELLRKFPQNYLADTEISCSVLAYNNLVIVPGKGMQVQFKWACLGSFDPNTGTRYTFLNFQPTLSYDISLKYQNYLVVYAKPTRISNLAFNIIDSNLIEEVTLVQYVIESVLFEFQCYTIGTYMQIGHNSSQVKLTAEGMWIG